MLDLDETRKWADDNFYGNPYAHKQIATLLALARAGRRLAEAAEEVSPDYSTIEDLRVAIAAWREADGG